MFLAPLPRIEFLGVAIRLFSEISSRRCDSRVVEDNELVSMEGAKDSFLEPVSFDRHRDLLFSGTTIEWVVFFRAIGGASKEIAELDVSCRWRYPGSGGLGVEKSGKGASTAPLIELGSSGRK